MNPPAAKALPDSWSPEEVAATVADYLEMLENELRGTGYNKADHRRGVKRLLNDRSDAAIEFKHANVSAVLIELGYPYIDGYKPRGNYQELLRAELITQLERRPEIARVTSALVSADVPNVPLPRELASVFVDAPSRERPASTYERLKRPAVRQMVNYLEREAANASLGAAGERFVLELEHRR